jgi:DNA-binding response OmpR family regulator
LTFSDAARESSAVGIRENPRVAASFVVRYALQGEQHLARCMDLSLGGMSIAGDGGLPINAVVRMMLQLPDSDQEMPIICRVVHLHDLPPGSAFPCAMGISFLDLAGEPLAAVERYIARAEVIGPVLTSPPLSLLIVDDDREACELAGGPFIDRGDSVRYAHDGVEGLASCLRDPPDVLILDVAMPKMDGWQLLRMIGARPSLASVSVVFVTTMKGDDERLLAYQLGADDFIGKPVRAEELLARVDRVMRRAREIGHPLPERKSLHGDLGRVALPSLLSFLEIEKKTGELLVLGEGTARLFLLDGRLLRVELEGSTSDSRANMLQILGWTRGQFEFAAQDVSGADELRSGTTALLLDLARAADEAAEARDKKR